MTPCFYSSKQIHPDWHPILDQAILELDSNYIHQLNTDNHWLPGKEHLFAALSMPLSSVRYILLGESPYPRAQSANGYAFWDGAVESIWSPTGFSKSVNRATSLRNFIKMLLYARGDLNDDFSQAAISKLDHSVYLQTASQLFGALIQQGVLLLNASLVYSEGKVPYHARQWRPFMHRLLLQLADYNPALELILFGRVAAEVKEAACFKCLTAEHPYNISFITHPDVVAFFKPMDLLSSSYENKQHG